jgi:hypothetical protein
MSDWIKLHRSLNDNPLWLLEPFTKAQAWVDMCLNANWKDGVFSVRGNVVSIKRGQLGWSEITMMKRWKWSRNKVRLFLSYLERSGNIVQQKTHITSITTICNYNTYQSGDTTEGITDDTTEGTTEGQQKVHDIRKKEGKKEKKNIDTSSSVSLDEEIRQLYMAYPRRVGGKKAHESIQTALKKIPYAELYPKVVAYAASVAGKDKQFIPLPTTWFNQERWIDDVCEAFVDWESYAEPDKVRFMKAHMLVSRITDNDTPAEAALKINQYLKNGGKVLWQL